MKPEFRIAHAQDLIFIARLLREFYEKAGSSARVEFDYESAMKTVEFISSFGICLVGPSSCAGAVILDYPFNMGEKVAHVTFWYFKNAREMAIFDAMCDACKAAGATRINAVSLFPHNRIARFYQRKGMTPLETVYTKSLN